jgi:Xaa-Pro aminopeptidase
MFAPFADRLSRVRERMLDVDVDAILVGPSPDLRYLVGYHAPALERLTLLVLPTVGEPTLIVPQLERLRAESSPAPEFAGIRTWGETDDPFEIVRQVLPHGSSTVAAGDRLWASFLLRIQAALPELKWNAASTVLGPVRARKDPAEIDALRRAGAIADAVAGALRERTVAGVTERDLARWIRRELLERGSERVTFAIVAAGSNAASPHHEPGDRVIEPGDTLVCDFGGTVDGYCSDITRTFFVGTPAGEIERAYAALLEAQEMAVEAVRPGLPAERVDAAARDVLDAAGYGELFVHRTGHGIGLEEHEPPWIVAGNDQALAPGMAFSVEPGIYAAGRFGMRIEDIVVVTDAGVERLNNAPRDAAVVR